MAPACMVTKTLFNLGDRGIEHVYGLMEAERLRFERLNSDEQSSPLLAFCTYFTGIKSQFFS